MPAYSRIWGWGQVDLLVTESLPSHGLAKLVTSSSQTQQPTHHYPSPSGTTEDLPFPHVVAKDSLRLSHHNPGVRNSWDRHGVWNSSFRPTARVLRTNINSCILSSHTQTAWCPRQSLHYSRYKHYELHTLSCQPARCQTEACLMLKMVTTSPNTPVLGLHFLSGR